jgi:hypothetical protein
VKLDKLIGLLPGKGKVMEIVAAIGFGFALCLAVLLWMEKRENTQLRDLNRGLISDIKTSNESVAKLRADLDKQNKALRLTRAIATARQQDLLKISKRLEAASAARQALAAELDKTPEGEASPITEDVWKKL